MQNKKNPKADIGRNSSIYFALGLALMMFMSYGTINYKVYDKDATGIDRVNMDALDEEEVPITEQVKPPPPPPPPPPAPEVIEIVEDEEEVEETIIESTESDEELEIEDIEIEERDEREVSEIRGVRIAPEKCQVYNPAFDMTPSKYVTGIITEEGICYPPFEISLRRAVMRSKSKM